MKVCFSILGEPQGKGRPRFVRNSTYVRTYTPEKTATYENLVKLEYERQCGGARFRDDECVELIINAFYGIPKSTSKRKRELMLGEAIRPIKKPDVDNVTKIIADSLNNIAYKDDAQIVDSTVRKFYSDMPRVQVIIQTARGAENDGQV